MGPMEAFPSRTFLRDLMRAHGIHEGSVLSRQKAERVGPDLGIGYSLGSVTVRIKNELNGSEKCSSTSRRKRWVFHSL